MKTILFVATEHGLLTLVRRENGWQEKGGAMRGHRFTSISGNAQNIVIGTRDGIFRSADIGKTWGQANAGLTQRHVRWLACHPDETDLAFAGTEPAAIFVSQDGGQSWVERSEVAGLRDDLGWYLPYSPEAGCVRGFAFQGRRGYAAVEQGGLLRTNNRGESWHLAGGSTGKPHSSIPKHFIHPDVHSVTVHPSSPDKVFAPTGGGLYHSSDGGETWTRLYKCYCRAVWVDPTRPGHLILGPADSVDRNGRIEQSVDGGETWEPIMHGLDRLWPRHMVERFAQVGDDLFAVLSNGQLLTAPLATLAWKSLLPPEQDVTALVPIYEP